MHIELEKAFDNLIKTSETLAKDSMLKGDEIKLLQDSIISKDKEIKFLKDNVTMLTQDLEKLTREKKQFRKTPKK